MNTKTFRVEIFLVAMAAILLEISYTRIFSFKLFYYFTYLTIGIVLLGMGSGGVLVAVFPRLQRMAAGRLVAICALLAAATVPIGYVLVAVTQLNALEMTGSLLEGAKLIFICTVLFIPFLLVGIVLSTIFGARPAEINRLYFADLVGAGLGCAISIPLFGIITPPGCIMLGGLIFAIAGLRLAPSEWRVGLWPGVALAALLGLGVLAPDRLPEPIADSAKTLSPQRIGDYKTLFSSWSTVFRIDVLDGFDPATRHLINHDGNIGSNLIHFDGDFASLKRFDIDVRSTPFSVVKPNPKVLIIGAAGGHEILASLYFDAAAITAVELNPVTVSLLTTHFADFTGRIAEHERVTLVNAEGRAFLDQDTNTYDLIWFVAPDSYAATNAASAGAFVLSESYLYTTEMIEQALGHLNPEGVVCLQTGDIDFARKPNRAARYLWTARSTFARLGIDDFTRHALVSSTPEMFTMVTILLGNDPFSEERIARFRKNAAMVKPVGHDTIVWHPPLEGQALDQPVQKVVALPDDELAAWYATYPYNLDPVTDNAPFFWHFSGFWDAVFRPLDSNDAIYDPEDAKGERVLLVLLGVTIVFSAIFLLLPLVMIRDVWRELPYKPNAGLYFAALGLGFMFFEVCLIQKLTLFLGYPTYSLTVTLFSMLVFSGVGSLLTERYAARRNRALGGLLATLAALVVWYQFGIGAMVDGFVGAPLPVRVLIAAISLAPLGLCLGAFMPIGLGTVSGLSRFPEAYIAWGWAVNGFFSVISSVLATILSMTIGFNLVLFLALLVYTVGIAALSRIPERTA